MSPTADQIVALIARSVSLQQQGQLEAALASLDEALALAPGFPVTLVKRGTLLLGMGRPRAALADFDLALQRSAMPHVLPLRDAALQAALAEAQAAATDAAGCCELAALLIRTQRPAEAEAQLRQALLFDSHHAPAWIALGNLLVRLNRLVEALACYEQVLQFVPGDVLASFNRGNVLQKEGRYAEALASYAQALAGKPDLAEARIEQAHCQLALGNWAEGWPLFEARWDTAQMRSARLQTGAPQWQGESRPQATLLLWAEQGLGDALQFVRYLPQVAARVGQVVLRVPSSLVDLFRHGLQALPNVAVQAHALELPPHELHCPMMSLPLALGTTVDSIPATVPYLTAPPSRLAKWDALLAARQKTRIALVWSGGQRLLNNPTRDMPLPALLPLLDGGIDAEWFCLQKELSEADALLLSSRPHIRRLDHLLDDFADTAAVLSHMDLLISVDTAVAHLAGALNLKTWLALRKSGEWRWAGDGERSAWYPHHRLFRQASHGDWAALVDALAKALSSFQS